MDRLLTAVRLPVWRAVLSALSEPLTAVELAQRLGEQVEIAEGHARVLAGMHCVELIDGHRYRATIRAELTSGDDGVTLTIASLSPVAG